MEKFHDYLYGSKFEAVTDNNPLTYIFTTAKLDATGQRWVASLSNYNFCIKYRSGKGNGDADGVSRLEDPESENVIFPEVLKAICQSVTSRTEECPFIECMALTDPTDPTDGIQEQLLEANTLSSKDWRKTQRDDPSLRCIIDNLQTGSRNPALQNRSSPVIDRRYLKDWDCLFISEDGVLYRRVVINEQQF